MSADRAFSGIDIRVLVADDEPSVVKLVESVLAGLGIIGVFRAGSGDEAIQIFDENADKIALVICDWKMPNASGLDVLNVVRQTKPDVPFIMLTGNSSREDVMRAREAGVSAYIRKPFSMGEIRDKVSRLLGQDI